MFRNEEKLPIMSTRNEAFSNKKRRIVLHTRNLSIFYYISLSRV